MVLRIDPRFPLVWRSPSSLQLGVDDPPVVLATVSEAEERIIAALVVGVGRSGLDMIARDAGMADGGLSALLSALRPALVAPMAVAPSSPVTITGVGPTARLIASTLRLSGVPMVADSEETGIAIIIAHYVIAPELHGHWLRRDLPHLPVVFGDTVVRIGPIVEPGTGPCLYCLELYRIDADPARPAIASQLWGRASPAESALVSSEVAAIVARMMITRLARGIGADAESVAESIELEAATGTRTVRQWLPHPNCGCISVGGAGASAVPQGIATAAEPHREPTPRVPRKGAVVGVLA